MGKETTTFSPENKHFASLKFLINIFASLKYIMLKAHIMEDGMGGKNSFRVKTLSN